MNAEELEIKLSSIEQLPALPLVLRQVQKIMDNPKSNMNQIAMVIAKDQALASKTIKLVNSAFYGMSKPVSSITQAIVILGLNTVTNLMLGLSVIKMFPRDSKTAFNHEDFWEHCFGTALIAKAIAQERNYHDKDECFIAGLLHDLGRLIFDQFLHEQFAKALTVAKMKNIALSRLEQIVFGADHAFTGALLARRWRLPESIHAAIKFHHIPESIPKEYSQYSQIVKIITTANRIANRENIGNSGENDPNMETLGFPLKLTDDAINLIGTSTKSEIKQTLRAFGI